MGLYSLIYLTHDEHVLMLYRNKKEIDINQNKWIGVGGKIEANEAPMAGAIREVKEETGIALEQLVARGVITFVYGDRLADYMFLYTAEVPTKAVIESDEGELKWIPRNEVMNLPMWEGDRYFLPPLLEEKTAYIEMKLIYNEHDELIDVTRFN
ncbi:NUDIX hydrolase [Atopobacter phocae]|uniref:NUDIX hydrolase n=1 Tax=Atopobacter phocae TaxID=136492 RepID=UPI000471633C|nr:8-oxo-dGTP diphosphatase [Atopobacter phocae]